MNEQITGEDGIEEKPRGPIGPVVVLLDIGDQCPSTAKEDKIREAIENKGLVKCLQIGDGFISTFVDDLDW